MNQPPKPASIKPIKAWILRPILDQQVWGYKPTGDLYDWQDFIEVLITPSSSPSSARDEEETDSLTKRQLAAILKEDQLANAKGKLQELESQLSLANIQLVVARTALELFPAAISEAGSDDGYVFVKDWEAFSDAVTKVLAQLSEGGGEKEPTADEALEWLFKYNPPSFVADGKYYIHRDYNKHEGSTPLEAVLSAMKGDK